MGSMAVCGERLIGIVAPKVARAQSIKRLAASPKPGADGALAVVPEIPL